MYKRKFQSCIYNNIIHIYQLKKKIQTYIYKLKYIQKQKTKKKKKK